MATQQRTMDFLLDQLRSLGEVSARKMFGEYCLYCSGKVVALVCDDVLYLKPTEAGRALLSAPTEAAPYPGAKPHWRIPPDQWEDAEQLCALLAATTRALPEAKKKRAPKP